MDTLIVHDLATKSRRTIELSFGRTVIGTSKECGVVVEGSGVGAIHCAITRVAGGFEVTDLGSPRGTVVNGMPIERAVVRDSDVVWIGSLELRVTLDPACEPGAPATAATKPASKPPAGVDKRAPQATGASQSPSTPPATPRVAQRKVVDSAPAPEETGRTRRPRPAAKKSFSVITIALMVSAAFWAVIALSTGGGEDKDRITDPNERLQLAAQLRKIRDFDTAIAELKMLAENPGERAFSQMVAAELEATTTAKDRAERAAEAVHRFGSDSSTAPQLILPKVSAALAEFADLPEAVELASMQRALELRVRDEAVTTRPDLRDKIISAQRIAERGQYGKAKTMFADIGASGSATAKQVAEQGAEFVEQAAATHAGEILTYVTKALAENNTRLASDFVDPDTVAGFQGTAVADIVQKIAEDVAAKRPLSVKKVPAVTPKRVLPTADPNAKDLPVTPSEGDDEAGKDEPAPTDSKDAGGSDAGAKASEKPTPAPSKEIAKKEAAKPDAEKPTPSPTPTATQPNAPTPPRNEASAAPQPEVIVASDALMRRGDFAGARSRLEAALPSAPQDLTKRLEWRIECTRLAEGFVSTLLGKVGEDPKAGGGLEVKTINGQSGHLEGVSHGNWVLSNGDGSSEVAPHDLEVGSLLALGRRYPLTAAESLQRAALALAVDESKDFAAALENASSDPAAKNTIDLLLALDRKVAAIPEYGFFLVEKKWLTFNEREQLQYAKRLREAIENLEGGERTYDKGVEQLHQIAPMAKELVVSELLARRAKLVEQVKASPEWKALDKLYAERQKLEAARVQAFELINDEKKYFYPYTPPSVPPDVAEKYHAVQQEVERRVAAVREIWGDEFGEPPKTGVELSDRFRRLLKLLATEFAFVVTYDPEHAVVEQGLERLDLLPVHVERMTVRDVALDLAERQRLDHDHKVALLNLEQTTSGLASELEQAKITNDYRRMLGRSALAINEKLIRSAHTHSEWMSKVGRLSHFNDEDSKLRTPGDRMRAQGYTSGAGENVARGMTTALAAHQGWAGSSGHHRNMLFESHTEMGVGVVGRFWTQNFGGGRSFEGNLIEEDE